MVKRPGRTRLRRLGFLIAAVAVLLVLVVTVGIDYWCEARPPAVQERPAIREAEVVTVGERRTIGAWGELARKDGVLYLRLAGGAYERGYANGALCCTYVARQEQELLDTVRAHVPSRPLRWLLRKYVTLRNRRLPDYVSARHQVEILGLTEGCPDPLPEVGHYYHRVLNYHAAHDIAHAVMDTSLFGCTSFAAWGEASANGHMLVGRNFDFEAGRCFDEQKVVMHVTPDEGHSYISVAWPGMVGVVTGMNDAGIAVAIHTAFSTDRRDIGTPVALVLRDVLQFCDSLDAALERVRASDTFVSDCFLVADAKRGAAVVIENTPRRTAVFSVPGEDTLVAANHFRSPELRGDPENLDYMAAGTTVPRLERMEALLGERRGMLTPDACVEILRDRSVAGHGDVGMGNRASINAVIAAHSVVMDVTAGIVWVSQGPHLVGGYVPFGLDGFPEAEEPGIGPDPGMPMETYERYRVSIARTREAREAMERGDYPQGIALLEEACALNPGYYEPLLERGRIALQWGAPKDAPDWFQRALEAYPPTLAERVELQGLIESVRNAVDSRPSGRKEDEPYE